MKKLSKIDESIWSDIQKRSFGEKIRKEDELSNEEKRQFICWYLRTFTSNVFYKDKYENSLNGFIEMLRSRTKLNSPTERIDAEISYLISNWKKGDNIQQQVNDDIKKIEKPFPYNFKKEPGKSIHQTLSDWWNTLDIDTKRDIVYYLFNKSEYKIQLEDQYGDDVDEYNTQTLDDIWNKEFHYFEQAEIYVDYTKKTNESIWSDIQKRNSGEITRKEDELTNIKNIIPIDIGMDILWADRDLEEKDGNTYFTYEDVKDIIKNTEWRLPTKSETLNLITHTILLKNTDEEYHIKGKSPTNELIFIKKGYKSKKIHSKESYCCWTSTTYENNTGVVLTMFINRYQNYILTHIQNKCCVRLVKDK